jgi:hypothetical protein
VRNVHGSCRALQVHLGAFIFFLARACPAALPSTTWTAGVTVCWRLLCCLWSQVAPCPRGEWKAGEGPSGNCTKCAFGVTTLLEGSTTEQNCTEVVPGRYASAISGVIVQSTQICPQKYYW